MLKPNQLAAVRLIASKSDDPVLNARMGKNDAFAIQTIAAIAPKIIEGNCR